MRESLTPSKPRERALVKTETNTRPAAVTMPITVPVLLPLALPAPYDYLVPEGVEVEPGQFVVAPLATVEYLAVVWPRPEGIPKPQIERAKLREIVEVLDDAKVVRHKERFYRDAWLSQQLLQRIEVRREVRVDRVQNDLGAQRDGRIQHRSTVIRRGQKSGTAPEAGKSIRLRQGISAAAVPLSARL